MPSDRIDYLEYLSPFNLHGKALLDLLDRMEEIEQKVYKNKRSEVTLGQRILLLKYSGLLEKIVEVFQKQKDQVSFLSSLLGADKDNIKKDLAAINLKQSKLDIPRNYEFLVSFFQEAGMEKEAVECQKKLDELLKKG